MSSPKKHDPGRFRLILLGMFLATPKVVSPLHNQTGDREWPLENSSMK
jgi:hypothetical protein